MIETDLEKNSKGPGLGSFFFLAIFCAAIVADQLSKHLAKNLFLNKNFAFSLPLPVWLMYAIYILVLGGMAYYARGRFRSFIFAVKLAWVLIFAGALCNIVERIFLGYVRDFIYITFYHWVGIYNLADFFIIAGVIILLLTPAKKN